MEKEECESWGNLWGLLIQLLLHLGHQVDSGTDAALGNIVSFTEQLLTRLNTILSILLPENGLILTSLKVLLHYVSTYSGEHLCVCVCACMYAFSAYVVYMILNIYIIKLFTNENYSRLVCFSSSQSVRVLLVVQHLHFSVDLFLLFNMWSHFLLITVFWVRYFTSVLMEKFKTTCVFWIWTYTPSKCQQLVILVVHWHLTIFSRDSSLWLSLSSNLQTHGAHQLGIWLNKLVRDQERQGAKMKNIFLD